jgi:hypothetical protein
VPDIKKVTKTTYSCECEDFCVPGPSQRCVVCDECGNKQHVYTPTCATMRTRKRLVKHDTTTEQKTYKWVVENLCSQCAAHEQPQAASAELAKAGGAEGRPVAYESVERPEAPASDAAAGLAPAGGEVKSQIRRLFSPVLGRGESAR